MNEKNVVIAACSIWNEEKKRDGPSGLGTMALGQFKLDNTSIKDCFIGPPNISLVPLKLQKCP